MPKQTVQPESRRVGSGQRARARKSGKFSLRTLLWVVVAAAVVAAGAWGIHRRFGRDGAARRPVPSGPNVVLISMDMVRPDHLHCYGYERETSPRLDRLAAEGVLFENHISSTSWTLPAHAALFTSLADSVHGCMDTDKRLAAEQLTLAEQFQAAGYRTAGFFSGPYLHPAFGLDQGFMHYEDCTSYAQLMKSRAVGDWDKNLEVMRKSHEDVTNPILYPAVKKWLAEHRGERFFLFVHMWDPHFDFIPPAPYDTLFDPDYQGAVTGRNFFFDRAINKDMPRRDLEHLLALYDGEIAWTDLYVGKIIDDLKAAGLLEDTVVAVTSDHGTEFFEHGLKGHRQTLFDESIRIPLIIRYPAGLPCGARIESQTRLIDVGPTLLALAGLAPQQDVMGMNLVPLAAGEAHTFQQAAISELFWRTPSREFALRAVRTRHWKYVDDQARHLRFFFDLAQDPGEQYALWDLTSGVGRSLHALYEESVRGLSTWREYAAVGVERAVLTDDMRRQLGSFGYVDIPQEEEGQVSTSRPTTQTTTATNSSEG